uniref:Uncharacterized protein n=1 Tax=Vitis vinifera TaxID=29760 RepID=F6HWX2_VITVI
MQIVKARAKLTQELQNRTKAKPEPESERGTYLKETTNPPHEEHPSVPSSSQSESLPLKTSSIESATSIVASDFPTEKHTVLSTKVQIVDKSVVEEGPVKEIKNQDSLSGSSSRILDEKYEDDGDDWLKEESSEIVGAGRATMPLVNEEDVSFSDLEEDDGDAPTSYKKVTYGSDSSTKDSRDWVQLSSSSADSAKDATGSEKVSAHNTETKESNDWLNVDDIDVSTLGFGNPIFVHKAVSELDMKNGILCVAMLTTENANREPSNKPSSVIGFGSCINEIIWLS